MDNLARLAGLGNRYGIAHVDLNTQKRIPYARPIGRQRVYRPSGDRVIDR